MPRVHANKNRAARERAPLNHNLNRFLFTELVDTGCLLGQPEPVEDVPF